MNERQHAIAILSALSRIPPQGRLHTALYVRAARRSLSDSEVALILDIEESQVSAICTPVSHHHRRVCTAPTRRRRKLE
ncbi:hypothetical protein [Nocardia nova]|uniref:hypothetical protein n=1 Tax=Nocardia nova TaxID=37330 RepID=UPI00046D25F5|nr:hypothetical protein [Nocardia nova]